MLGLGLLLGWLSVYLIPLATRAGLSETAANRLPFLGFFLGVALGVASVVSKTTNGLVTYALLVPVSGSVFWFFGVLAGGLLVACGVSPEAADYAPAVAFCLGLAVALLPGIVVGSDAARGFFTRRSKPKRVERQ
jgi:hypothetical protein